VSAAIILQDGRREKQGGFRNIFLHRDSSSRLGGIDRQLEELAKKTQDYEILLETLGGTVADSAADKIRRLLEKVCFSFV
jgi:hypothetical protein